jgi:hypothetical protein
MPNEEMGNRVLPQPPDVDSRAVIAVTIGFLVFVALSMAGLFFYLRADAPGALNKVPERQFPEPSLQRAPQNDFKQFEAEQRAALSGYAWIDRNQDIARIPIEDAMRIIAARGEHAYDPLDAPGLPATAARPQQAKP